MFPRSRQVRTLAAHAWVAYGLVRPDCLHPAAGLQRATTCSLRTKEAPAPVARPNPRVSRAHQALHLAEVLLVRFAGEMGLDCRGPFPDHLRHFAAGDGFPSGEF